MTHKALIRRLQISCLGLDPIDPLRLLVDDVIEALADHIEDNLTMVAQPEPLPQGWSVVEVVGGITKVWPMTEAQITSFSLSEQPPQRTWVGLTDEEYKELHLQMGPVYYYQEYGQAIEAKLKQKNGYAEEKNT